MKLLLLGEKSVLLKDHLEKSGHSISHHIDKISLQDTLGNDFIISFGYKFLLPKNITDAFKNRTANLHISYLPFNRGADPNLWSFLDNTVKGVTIHAMEERVDAGHILLRKTVELSHDETLKTSYDKLINEIVSLFINNSTHILGGKLTPIDAKEQGSFHKKSDKEKYLYLIENKGYDTPVAELTGKASDNK